MSSNIQTLDITYQNNTACFFEELDTARNSENTVCLETVEKSGTYLLKKVLSLLNISKRNYIFKNEEVDDHRHLSRHYQSFLNNNLSEVFVPNRKYLILYRDPRDLVISQIFFHMRPEIAKKSLDNPKALNKYTFSQLLDISLNSENILQKKLGSYATQLFKSLEVALELKRNPAPNRQLIRFEDLVPSFAGGASPKRRYAVLKEICDFAEKKVAPGKIKSVMRECWGGTNTFRHDDIKKVGQWKKYFEPHHIKVFQEKYNDLLLGLGYETDPNWHLKYINN